MALIVAVVIPLSAAVLSVAIGQILNAKSPGLKVDEVQIALAQNIDANNTIPGSTVSMSAHDTGSAIDITLRNTGRAPALLVEAILHFTRIAELRDCPAQGGSIASSATYEISVPAPYAMMVDTPFVIRRDMRFEVDANSIDRMRITVGPRVYYYGTAWPWIYQFNLSLVEDNGEKLNLGPMSILGFSPESGSNGAASWDPLQHVTQSQVLANGLLGCLAVDATALSHAMKSPGLHSPELSAMYRQAERLTTFRSPNS